MTTTVNTPAPNPQGLAGIVAATTALSKVEGNLGRLIYRGYNIHDLAKTSTFEEVAHLLWAGHLPNSAELAAFKTKLAAHRKLSPAALSVLQALPKTAEPMDVLRTAVSADGATGEISGTPTLDQAIMLTARIPVILAAFARLRSGQTPLESRADLGHAANYLYLMTGEVPSEAQERALNAYLVMLADHGMNASTFTARVVASTQSDLASAVVAAIGALKGPLHGGAPSKVKDMLEEIRAAGGKEGAEKWLRGQLDSGQVLMGFGHRVYRTVDPRAEELKGMAELASPQEFEFASYIEDLALRLLGEYKPGRKIYTNVEYYSAVLLGSLGLPGDFFTPTFASSRVAGWTAHVLEQAANNRIIRPESDYTGPETAAFVPLAQR
ncbi:MAG: citrate synthase/methylcitrate synthase [Chloroflexi bacterium]|nr:citrate synthase/methylcitrate synthase [Chloroflexota bacterium]OJV96548.1 MAG: citrate synthase/methylcitrate synthase [Chloroflexi bacterium 54-19]